jgi:hypothetical protein
MDADGTLYSAVFDAPKALLFIRSGTHGDYTYIWKRASGQLL